MGATLIFPCSVPDGERYAAAASERGEPVVAASSIRYDETAERFATWFYLPSVHADDFSCRLTDAIAKYDIARVFCPVPAAQAVLHRLATEGRMSVPIFGEFPIRRHLSKHRRLMADAMAHHAFIRDLTEGRSALAPIEIAAVLRQANSIFGESDAIKMAAMMAAFTDAPRGDVVEIGVLAGRSAYVLGAMARRHRTGAVLAIDAWNSALAVQRDTQKAFQAMIEAESPTVPLECFFESFIVSLLPLGTRGGFNYLVQSSTIAHQIWSRQRQVASPHFGETRYAGAIAVLHIDANHDYDSVREDCALWLPDLLPGGWLILDDYVWFHGDGPRRVGDALLAEYCERVERAFVSGKALFIKLGS
jgi:hypothetical protein